MIAASAWAVAATVIGLCLVEAGVPLLSAAVTTFLVALMIGVTTG